MARLFVPLDVNFPDDDKIEAVGLAGAGLYAQALCVAKRLLEDGRLTRVKLRKLGADDALIDRCIEVGLFTPDAGDAVRITAWLGHNAPAESVLTSDKAKRLAHQRHHVLAGKSSPDCRFCQAEEPQVNAETCGEDADRTPTQCGHALPEVEVETETPTASLRTTPVPDPPEHSHADEAAAPASDPDPTPAVDLEQQTRRTAVLVGRAIADTRPGTVNPTGYAAGVTRQILDPAGDGIDRTRIERLLADGQTPETIAAAWATPTDPLTGILDGPNTEPAAPRPHPPAFTGHDQPPRDDTLNATGIAAARAAIRGIA